MHTAQSHEHLPDEPGPPLAPWGLVGLDAPGQLGLQQQRVGLGLGRARHDLGTELGAGGQHPVVADHVESWGRDEGAEACGGYCSSFDCAKDTPSEEQCGPDAFCFDMEAYTEAPIWFCLKLCDNVSDCRDGYVCTDAQGSSSYPPFPHKACIAPDLLCLLAPSLPECT